MPVRKTIAVITSVPEKASAIAGAFSRERCNLLILAKEREGYDKVLAAIKRKNEESAVELHDCMRDGCWEADAIIIDVKKEDESEVAESIKEVAIQKIVVNISEECDKKLQQLLPYSKVKTLSEIPASFMNIIEDE